MFVMLEAFESPTTVGKSAACARGEGEGHEQKAGCSFCCNDFVLEFPLLTTSSLLEDILDHQFYFGRMEQVLKPEHPRLEEWR